MDTFKPWIICMCCVLVFVAPVQASIKSYMDRYWQWRMDQSPEFATKAGSMVNQDKLQQLTEDAFLKDKNNAEDLLNEAVALTHTALDSEERIVLRVVQLILSAFIDGYKYRKYTQYNPITPMDYPSRDWKNIISQMPLHNITDYENIISRYRAIAVQVDQMIALMRKAITANTTQHGTALTGEDDRLNSLLGSMANRTSFFHKPFYSIPQSINKDQMENLMTSGFDVIQYVLTPAVVKLRRFLSQEYAPHTRPDPGISSLPGGAEVYQKCLQWHLDLPMTAQEVHQMGHAEVHRIYTLMMKIKREAGFSGSMEEYLAHLKAQPENYYRTEEDMLNGYREIIADVHSKLDKVLLHVPDNCTVEVVQNMNPQGWARYASPTKDGTLPGRFIINVFNPDTRPTFAMKALTLHEAEPGHHTMACAKMAENKPLVENLRVEYRKYYAVPFNFPFFTSANEGWALYAESLGEVMEVYTDPLSLLGRYTSELFRAARLVVDTGIHAYGWSREYAINYLANYTTRSMDDIGNEINRYITWPGQACSYKVGELKLQELRMHAKRKLGASFNIRTFNQKILSLGGLPISMIQEIMFEWIDFQYESSFSGTCTLQYSNIIPVLLVIACHWLL